MMEHVRNYLGIYSTLRPTRNDNICILYENMSTIIPSVECE